MNRTVGRDVWIGGLLLLASLALGYALLSKGHAWGDDFASYLGQAKAVCAGSPRTFIAQNRFTIENSTSFIGPVAYPWGTPVLLAPLVRFFGLNPLALKLLNPLLYALFLVVLFLFFRREHGPLPRLLLLALFALSPYMLSFLDNLLSDVPFLLVSTLSVFLIGRIVADGRKCRSETADAILLGVLIACASFFRTNGLLLLGTLAATQLIAVLRRRRSGPPSPREWVAIFLPYAVFGVLTLAWYAFLPLGGSTGAAQTDPVTMESLLHNLRYYARIPEEFFAGVFRARWVYLLTIPLMITGMIRRAARDAHLLIYWALTLGLYVAYPGIQGLRYLFPALPLTFHFVFAGAGWCLDGRKAPWAGAGRALALCLALAVTVQFGYVSLREAGTNLSRRRILPAGPFTPASAEMFAYVRDRLPPGSVMEFFKPRAMRLFTDHPSILVNRVPELARGEYLCTYDRPEQSGQLAGLVVDSLAAHGALRPVFSNADFRIFEIAKAEAGARPEQESGAAR